MLGYSAEIDKIQKFVDKNSSIEDNCEAVGATFKGKTTWNTIRYWNF